MRNAVQYFFVFTLLVFLNGCSDGKKPDATEEVATSLGKYPEPVSLANVVPQGDLGLRLNTNFTRLHQGRYRPQFVHTWPSVEYHQEKWPADLAGRLILTLSLEEQALGKKSPTLRQLVDDLEGYMNEKKYLGKIYWPDINEQQLSGHGWLLDGLTEYYKHTGDEKALQIIRGIVENLVLPTRGHHEEYPIDPDLREDAGDFMGSHLSKMGNLILSTDVGCDFIFMTGVIKAYEILPSPELKQVIDEMVDLFLKVDEVTINAQTHATLTALRGLLRYSQMEDRPELLEEVERRFAVYKTEAMTENYENYNWYGRPRWTEPCAVVDSYIIAMNLWRMTGKPRYLEDAQHIYYNGFGFEQRYNGGFGCSSCLGAHSPVMELATDDTHWCCTMRGGVGLSRALQNAWLQKGRDVWVTDYKEGAVILNFGNESVTLTQTSNYPLGGDVSFRVTEGGISESVKLHLFLPQWVGSPVVRVNGVEVDFVRENGFAQISVRLEEGTAIGLNFDIASGTREPVNKHTIDGYFAIHYGPLVLGAESEEEVYIPGDLKVKKVDDAQFRIEGTDIMLKPVRHLLHPDVRKEYNASEYSIQALFTGQKDDKS